MVRLRLACDTTLWHSEWVDSDEHIEMSTTPEGKILQSYNSGKCEPKLVFEKLTAIITKKNPAWGRLFSFALEKKKQSQAIQFCAG